MGKLIDVLKTTDLAGGQMKAVTVEGQDILIAQIDGKYYATSNVCPHRGGRLSDGILNGTVVQCPLHGSQFNLATGQVMRRVGGGFTGKLLGLLKVISSIKIYRIEVEGETIKVEV